MSLHQDVCDAYNINRYELAEKLGVSKSTLDSWSDESRMSKVTRLALELILDNYVKTKLLSDFGDNIAKISKFCNSSFNTLVENDDQKKIVSRIRYIIDDYGLNTITASKKLNLPDFEYLDKILKTQIYPSFDFLEKFSESFFISNDWLNTGKVHSFSLELANSYYLSHLSKKIKDFKQIYIVHSKDNKAYTKVIVEDL
ncbi:helix-turn-helix domain-containing protein [Campylobacter concisus]|uniref:helix-turn-helix domain-containing protein n=1 Tax=Campylobacter concisus TaxID=199 RepID=UPI000D3D6B3E|nr:helix-turn-helix domain-containing protein [Campylobacter concisus]